MNPPRKTYAAQPMPCPNCGQPMPASTPAAPEPERRKIGDKVFVTADNYGSECTIVAYRDSDGALASHYKVRSATDEFWALDFEISEV